jgi:replicative DNA helicase
MIHQPLPHSAEAEQGVLGSILISPKDAIPAVVQRIDEKYFYVPAHKTIYSVLIELWEKEKGIDLISFTQILRDRNLLEKVGGASFVTSLFTFVPTASNVGYYIDIVEEKHKLREIILACTEGARRAYHEQDNVDDVLEYVQSAVLKAGTTKSVNEKTAQDYGHEALDSIEQSRKNKGKFLGLSTGLHDLDKKLGGLRAGQFVVVAGDTSQGKTSLALRIATHNCLQSVPVGIISLEMTGSEIFESCIQHTGKVDLHTLAMDGGKDDELEKIGKAAMDLMSSPIYIKDESDVTLVQLRATGRALRADKKVELLIVDYLQLLSAQQSKDSSREREVAAVSRTMKAMAKELGIPVIGLSQVNDFGKVRESRGISHDADKLIYIEHELDPMGLIDQSWLNVDKNRRGPTGKVPVAFVKKYALWSDMAHGVF